MALSHALATPSGRSRPPGFGMNTQAQQTRPFPRADAGTRTPDPFITSEVLYQLSYVGKSRANRPFFAHSPAPNSQAAGTPVWAYTEALKGSEQRHRLNSSSRSG